MYRKCWEPVKEALNLSCEMLTQSEEGHNIFAASWPFQVAEATGLQNVLQFLTTDADTHLVSLERWPVAYYSIGLVPAEGRSEILVVLLQIALFFHSRAEWLPLPLVIALLLPDVFNENMKC